MKLQTLHFKMHNCCCCCCRSWL